MKSLIPFFLLLVACFSFACAGGSSNAQRYDLTGKVVAVEPEKHLVTVAHEEIEGFMPAMTMPFTVRNKSDLQILAPNDKLTATLVVDGAQFWLEGLIIVKASENVSEAANVTTVKESDEVPNFTLRNQDDREIRINKYRGKALLLTFIYTRCPIPEYCTLMSNNFAQVDRDLAHDVELYGKTHLLSISIDPDYDTPQVLRSYGAAHTERYEKETFAHWEFASGTKEEVKEIAQFFGLSYFSERDEIIHGLRTVIISPDGKVAKIYSGNEWKPEEVVEELKKAIHR